MCVCGGGGGGEPVRASIFLSCCGLVLSKRNGVLSRSLEVQPMIAMFSPTSTASADFVQVERRNSILSDPFHSYDKCRL